MPVTTLRVYNSVAESQKELNANPTWVVIGIAEVKGAVVLITT